MKKFFIIFIIFLIGLIVLSKIYESKTRIYVNKYLWPYIPLKIQFILKILYSDKFMKQFQNDYNVRFLPQTQLVKINFYKKKLNFLTERKNSIYNKKTYRKSFQIEIIENNKAWIIDNAGIIFEINLNNIIKNTKEKIGYKIIKSNINPHQVLDSFIHKNTIYLSFMTLKDKCYKFNIYKAAITKNNLNFIPFFAPNECSRATIQGGRIQSYTHKNKKGIIFTIGDGSSPDFNTKNAQDLNSVFGKILFKSFDANENYNLFSLGHRNPQGLYVNNDLILSTEHGPRGGDEINKIVFQKNYGWPISSYGERYFNKELKYKKDHASHGFEEPIFSFVPSIGISEIIKLPNDFSSYWKDNFILSSLNDASLYRIKFSKKFDKIILYEKIYIGERIRDLKYSKNNKTILLALESQGNIGVFRTN